MNRSISLPGPLIVPWRLRFRMQGSCSRPVSRSASAKCQSPVGGIGAHGTDLPFCKPQVHFPSSLRLQSWTFFERPSDDSSCDCQIPVVAAHNPSQLKIPPMTMEAYERPAAFHANAMMWIDVSVACRLSFCCK